VGALRIVVAALGLLVVGRGDFGPALVAATLLGLGTALVYPTLIAAVSDVVEPRDRASAIGVYRFWRDAGFVAGALLAGFVADALGSGEAIPFVAGRTALSGLAVATTTWRTSPEAMAAIGSFPLDDGHADRSLGSIREPTRR
jgi:MFS family permease